MNIIVAVRCYNESRHIARFLKGYEFCNKIVISDGGSTDGSVEIIKAHPLYQSKIQLLSFDGGETVNGQFWNTDAPHMNYVLDAAKELKPDWLLFDDMDCNPNWLLRDSARYILESLPPHETQVNAFRLYLWGETGRYFPFMNRNFDPAYTSLWGWRPGHLDIRADPNVRHGTLIGTNPSPYNIELPFCLLHRSWYPDTIQAKVDRYNALGLPMNHPLEHPESYGKLEPLPEWAVD